MLQTKKSASIDYLKAFAAIFVVLHHAIVYIEADRSALGWEVLRNLITATHVPLFFVIAGFLCYKQKFGAYIQKKLLRILVPFFTFSALKLVYSIFVSNDFSHGGSVAEQIFDAFIVGQLYWFPYAILISYCLATLFWTPKNEKATAFKTVAVPAVIVCLILLNRRYYVQDFKALSYFQLSSTLRFFAYFLIGMFIRQHKDKLSSLFQKGKWVILPICLVLMAYCSWVLVTKRNQYLYTVDMTLGLSFMVVLLAIFQKLPQNIRPLKLLGKYSLQVMFFDSFNKVVIFAILAKFISSSLALIPLAVVCNLLITCVCCLVIERIPKIRTLFGL